MKKTAFRWSRTRVALAAVLVSGLTACGGGGGGGEPEPTLIDLTAANLELAAHVAAAGPMALGVSSVAQIAGDGGPVGGLMAPAAGGSGLAMAIAQRQVLAALLGATGQEGRRTIASAARTLGVGSYTENCPGGGSVTVTFDDRDGNGFPSVGDTITFSFAQCVVDGSRTDGSIAADVLRTESSPWPSIGTRMTMSRLTSEEMDGRHAVTADGALLVDFAYTSVSTEWMRTAAEGEVTASVRTHEFADTVTMRPGYAQESTYDGSVGSTAATFSGTIRSAALGGAMAVSTNAAFVQYDADPNPRSGTLQASGNRGILKLQAVSTSDVRVELDDNNCGVAEYTQTRSWDWLM